MEENNNMNENVTNNNSIQKDKKGFAIAALVLGIIAIILCCLWYVAIPCGILALIFGILGRKSSKRGMSIAGIITGVIGMILSIVLVIVVVANIFSIVNDFSTNIEADPDYYDYSDSPYSID